MGDEKVRTQVSVGGNIRNDKRFVTFWNDDENGNEIDTVTVELTPKAALTLGKMINAMWVDSVKEK